MLNCFWDLSLDRINYSFMVLTQKPAPSRVWLFFSCLKHLLSLGNAQESLRNETSCLHGSPAGDPWSFLHSYYTAPPDLRQKNTCHILPHLPQTQATVKHPESNPSAMGTNAKFTLQCVPVFVKKTHNKESPHVEETGSPLESQKNKPQTKLNRIISKVTVVGVWTPKSEFPLGQTHWNLPHDNKHQQQL